MREHWTLDPAVTFLNHGSFGACPRAVLEAQADWRARMERQPVQFMMRDRWALLDAAREAVAAFVDAPPDGLVFVRNASEGVNAVLRSLELAPDDELLVLDHAYGAVLNAARFVARRADARVTVARLPWPRASVEGVVDAVLDAVTPRTRLCVLDHVTSPTGLVLPIERLVPALAERGVDTLVDGAHGPGQVELSLRALQPAYYAANLHKWVCAPKGAAFLWVRPDRRAGLRPLTISHGHAMPEGAKARLHLEFDWTGTDDPTPWLCAPTALEVMGGLLPGGWPALRARNRAVALEARATLCGALGVVPPCEPAMVGAMAAAPLPDDPVAEARDAFTPDPLQLALVARGFEVPVVPFPAAPQRLVRVSAQLYNHARDYRRLARALTDLLA